MPRFKPSMSLDGKNHRKLDDALWHLFEILRGVHDGKPQKPTSHAGEGEKRLIKLPRPG